LILPAPHSIAQQMAERFHILMPEVWTTVQVMIEGFLIASVAALKGEPALAGYSATKGALISLTRTLGVELAPQKIRVNCISPALVMTQMADGVRNTLPPENMEQLEKKHPLGLGTTDDVAYTIACLLAPGARWITGANIVLDGGYTA